MTRKMTVADLPRLMPILEDEARVAMRYPDHLNAEFVTAFWSGLMGAGSAMCHIAERDGDVQGFLLGLQAPDLYSGRPTALEQFWYVRKGFGNGMTAIRLLGAFLADAELRGCVRIMVGDWQPVGGPDLSRTYARFGFSPLERYYVKEVVCH